MAYLKDPAERQIWDTAHGKAMKAGLVTCAAVPMAVGVVFESYFDRHLILASTVLVASIALPAALVPRLAHWLADRALDRHRRKQFQLN